MNKAHSLSLWILQCSNFKRAGINGGTWGLVSADYTFFSLTCRVRKTLSRVLLQNVEVLVSHSLLILSSFASQAIVQLSRWHSRAWDKRKHGDPRSYKVLLLRHTLKCKPKPETPSRVGFPSDSLHKMLLPAVSQTVPFQA